MEFKGILYSRDPEKGIVRITINRPQVRNALNKVVRQELREAMRHIEQDQDVRVVVITGAGDKAFVSGADIGEFKDADPTMIRRIRLHPRAAAFFGLGES